MIPHGFSKASWEYLVDPQLLNQPWQDRLVWPSGGDDDEARTFLYFQIGGTHLERAWR